MRLVLEFSGEHPTLPRDEAWGALAALGLTVSDVEGSHRHLVADVEGPRPRVIDAVRRLALTFTAMESLFSCEARPEAMLAAARGAPLPPGKTFAVRARELDLDAPTPLHPGFRPPADPGAGTRKGARPPRIEHALGDAYGATNRVNLTRPDLVVRALLARGRCHAGVVLWENDRSLFEARRVQFRPMVSPVSLHPKLARAVVNLSRAPPGGIVYDPFCGTGGLLLEAGLMGMRPVGSDVDERMVQGTGRTLVHFGVKEHTLFACDVGDAPAEVERRFGVPEVDAIVSDLPYGRSATTKSEQRDVLYERAFRTFARLLRPEGRAVVGVPSLHGLGRAEGSGLVVDAVHPYRVHRSLTRHFAVLRHGAP